MLPLDDQDDSSEEHTVTEPSHHPCGCRVTMPELTGYEEHVCEYQRVASMDWREWIGLVIDGAHNGRGAI